MIRPWYMHPPHLFLPGAPRSIALQRHYYKWIFFKRILSITYWKDCPSFMTSWKTSEWQQWCMLHDQIKRMDLLTALRIHVYSQSSTCTARLILHQLRWSEYIVDPQALSGKLIEVNTDGAFSYLLILTTFSLIKIIHITPPVIQHEIITSLPDIINDTEHKVIIHSLANDKMLTKDHWIGYGGVSERAYEREFRVDCTHSWRIIESHIAFGKLGKTCRKVFGITHTHG